MKKGFTLLELLIVVVMVAALAAIALPQYNYSVEKGRAVKAAKFAKEVFDAQEVYRFRNEGGVTRDSSKLPISLKGTISKNTVENDTVTTDTEKLTLYLTYLEVERESNYGTYFIRIYYTASGTLRMGTPYCRALSTESAPNELCQSIATGDAIASSGSNYYKL